MNQFEMVVLIVAIVMLAGVVRAKYHARGREVSLADDPEAAQMREEIKTLRDRVAVLERIATDKNHLLEQEIEQLRDR